MRFDVDFKDEKQCESWREAWKKAQKTCRLIDGYECGALWECSGMTQVVCRDLWRTWHESLEAPKTCSVDAVSLEGENLVHALVMHVFLSEPTAGDILAVTQVANELSNAGLVLQQNPGRWDICFGHSYTEEQRAAHEQRRADSVKAYGSVPPPVLVRPRKD